MSDAERTLFRKVVREVFHAACERFAVNPRNGWPKSIRVKPVQGSMGIWEMTWSFAGPDGRATFEWVEIDGERALRWRRVGGHSIFSQP
jgi:hypothetical protein